MRIALKHSFKTENGNSVWCSARGWIVPCPACLACSFLLPTRISVLVGAPKANTSQPGIVEAGAVYYCPWPGLPESCRQIPFDNSSKLPETLTCLLLIFLMFLILFH